MKVNQKWLGLVAIMTLTQPLQTLADKSEYNLFNPTPHDEWRDMSADRPDFTESPITVDAGAWQLEASFIDFTRSDSDNETTSVLPFNLKLGLTNNMDLQLVVDPYVYQRTDDANTDGFGDTQLRLKINFWGNDGGDTALGIMPFIKFPTAKDDLGNDKFEGGIILPFSITLTEQLGLGLMLEVDAVYDEEEDDYGADTIASGVLGYDVGQGFGLYLEGIVLATDVNDHDLDSILGLGTTYSPNDNLTFDIGCNFGLSDEMDDFNVFGGITFRF
jgi:Putative MetA-pathway of phenol degradation